MITKQFRITVVPLVLAAMASLHVSAGQVPRKAEPLKIQKQVYLSALYHYNYKDLVVTNNSSRAIPQGTTINWSIRGQVGVGFQGGAPWTIKGSFSLDRALPVGGQVTRHGVAGPASFAGPYKEEAWYLPGSAPEGPQKAEVKPNPGPVVIQKTEVKPLPPKVVQKAEPFKVHQRIYLTAEYVSFGWYGRMALRVFNNSDVTIAYGARINWSIKGNSSSDPSKTLEQAGSFFLTRALQPGHEEFHPVSANWIRPCTAKAWYDK